MIPLYSAPVAQPAPQPQYVEAAVMHAPTASFMGRLPSAAVTPSIESPQVYNPPRGQTQGRKSAQEEEALSRGNDQGRPAAGARPVISGLFQPSAPFMAQMIAQNMGSDTAQPENFKTLTLPARDGHYQTADMRPTNRPVAEAGMTMPRSGDPVTLHRSVSRPVAPDTPDSPVLNGTNYAVEIQGTELAASASPQTEASAVKAYAPAVETASSEPARQA